VTRAAVHALDRPLRPVSGTEQVEAILRSTPWLMDALRVARDVDAPDWLIGAGAVRTAVWDHLHGFDEPTEPADVDVAFFDPDDLSPERDSAVEGKLRERRPDIPWDAKNQAAVHLWYPAKFGYEVPPLASAADGVATWPETATCIGARLERDDAMTVVAPYGVEDLLGLVHRRNPARITVEEYERRLRTKRITERWPRVRVLA
jgi:uncharacterized protein